MNVLDTLENLLNQTAFMSLTPGNYIMILVACVFLYLAIKKGYEPLLLVPIAFGMLLVNMYPDIMLHPEDSANGTGGLLTLFLYYWMNGSYFAITYFPWSRCDDRLWSVNCKSKEFPY